MAHLMEGVLMPPDPSAQVVLIVDCDRAIRTLIQCLLEREGYSVLATGSGEAALAIFRQYHASIGLLLTDVNIPDVSGPELARHLQQLKPELPVLCVSSEVYDPVHQGFACLPKPFTIRELVGR